MRKGLSASVMVALATCVLAVGCSRKVAQPDAAQPRIITFSPALTKLVFDMGLGDHVVGVTTYCRLPDGVSRPVVGDNLNIRVEPMLAVKSDMLLVQMELKHFESLRRIRPDLAIEHFTIETLSDIAEATERIGTLLGSSEVGRRHRQIFLDRLEALGKRTADLPRQRVCFIMGTRNPSGPGRKTFIDEMITLAGGTNVLAERYEGWRSPGLETIIKLAPTVIICQCKPGREAVTAEYWRSLEYPDGRTPRVITVTNDDWTLPAGHLSRHAEQLTEFFHGPISKGTTP